MNAEKELEWESLQNLWRKQPAASPPARELLRRVRRQEWRLRLGSLSEWLVAIGLCTFALYLVVSDFTAVNLVWGLIVCALVAWALSFSIDNRRDLWCPAEENAQAYIDLALLRLERKRRAICFVWILYAVELGIFALWDLLALVGWWEPLLLQAPLRSLAWVAGFTLALALWSLLAYKRVKKETAVFERLRGELIL